MKPERLSAVARAFQLVLERPDLRDSILDAECGDDDSIRADVEALLDADSEASGFLEMPLVSVHPADKRTLVGRHVGAYLVGELLGRGGMGAVYRAIRVDADFEQAVAIKFLSPAVRSRALVARFHQERQILARLSHPHIARLFDGGTTEDGLPYLVMELVDGLAITDYCAQHPLSIDDRLRLFCRVAAAVEAAHRSLIIHRDLKPSNILVDEHGEPKLLDFGLAKNLEDDTVTTVGMPWMAIMTPRYASPEQLRGEPLTVATDVYSLGLILFELLTGTAPPRTDTQARSDVAVVKAPIPSPSSVLASGDGRHRESIHRDLDTLVLKAVASRTGERYGSVGGLLEDLDRFLDRMPIRARRPTLAYRSARFIARNRFGVAVTAVLLAAVSSLAILLGLQAAETRDQRDRARETLKFVTELFVFSNPDEVLGDTPTARSLLDNGARRIELLYSGRPAVHGDLLDILGQIHARFGLSETAMDLLEQGQTIRVAHDLGPEERIDGLLALVDVHMQLDRYADARSNLDEAHQLLSKHGSRLPEQRVNAASLEAVVLKSEARPVERAAAARRSVELSRKLLGDAHDETISNLGLLADAEIALGNDAIARDLLAEATELVNERDTPYPTLHGLLYRRARLARAAGRYQEAVALSRRSLEEASGFFTDHRYLGVLEDHLADNLLAMGRHDEAITIYRRLLPADPSLYTRSNGNALSDLGQALGRSGRSADAREAFETAIELFLQGYGARHPNTIAAQFGLASLLHRDGDLAAAQELFERCLRDIDVLDNTIPAGYPRTGYAWLLLEMDELERSLALATEGLDLIEETHPEGHWRLYWAAAVKGAALASLGQRGEGERIVRDAMDSLMQVPGLDVGRVRSAARRLRRAGFDVPPVAGSESVEVVSPGH